MSEPTAVPAGRGADAAVGPSPAPSPSSSGRALAYMQLVRLPNVFTAIADVAMGFLVTRPGHEDIGLFALLLLTSCSLYLAGMVLNDVFDIEQDRLERPQRPIPSGRVRPRAALVIAFSLLLAGLTFGMATCVVTRTLRPGVVASVLALCILLYDAALKSTPAGPIAMGGCRMLNVLLGMSLAVDASGVLRSLAPHEWVIAAGIGVYIAGVTWFARTEARESSRRQLTAALAVLIAGLGLLASVPEWTLLMVSVVAWYAVWAVIAVFIGEACVAAIREPAPRNVQLAIKRCLMSLILLDAAVCFGLRGPVLAAAILLLLIPQWLLGRYVYST